MKRIKTMILTTLAMVCLGTSTAYGATSAPAGYFGSDVPAAEQEMIRDIYGRFMASETGEAATDQYYQIGLWGNWLRALETCCFHSAKPTALKIQSDSEHDGVYRIRTEYTGDMAAFRQHEAEYEAEVSRVVAAADDMTEEEKVRFFHDYIVNRCEYDYTFSRSRAYDCLINGSSVCNGYAAAFYNICSAAGLEANYIVGMANDGTGLVSHAWNRVKVNGQWLYFDVTFDDTTRSDAFYGLSEQEMGQHHFPQEIV